MGDKWGAQCEMTRGQEYVGESGGGRINKIGEGGRKTHKFITWSKIYIYIYRDHSRGCHRLVYPGFSSGELTGHLLRCDGKEGSNAGQFVHALSLPFFSSTPDLGEESVTVSMRAQTKNIVI